MTLGDAVPMVDGFEPLCGAEAAGVAYFGCAAPDGNATYGAGSIVALQGDGAQQSLTVGDPWPFALFPVPGSDVLLVLSTFSVYSVNTSSMALIARVPVVGSISELACAALAGDGELHAFVLGTSWQEWAASGNGTVWLVSSDRDAPAGATRALVPAAAAAARARACVP